MKKTLLDVASGKVKGHQYRVEFWGGEVAEVFMIDFPANPRYTLARATRGYTGKYDLDMLKLGEVHQMLKDLKNTKLGTPAEMLNFVFLIRDVPRSWTHQAVRTRIGAAVVQESTRFIGAKDVYGVLVPKTMHHNETILPDYRSGILNSIHSYEQVLCVDGAESQDARNLLPHSVLTHMFWSLNLRALMGIYEVRWCCQAEPSTWIPVMKQMREQIERDCSEEIAAFLTAPIDRDEPCGFNASFDRPCSWRKR